MRILHVDTGREMRGGQWQVLYLAGGLRSAGHEVMLLAHPFSPLFAVARKHGIPTAPLSLWSLTRMARRHHVTHAHDARAHSLAALAGASPLVVSRRVAFDVKTGLASKWKYSVPQRFIAVSEFVKARLVSTGVAAERISVVYDGVPLERERESAEDIIAPATADPMKGSELVAKAAALAGVEVLFSKHLSEDLRRAAMLIYISYSEGLGSGALLAMAAGVPVIASRAGGLPEVVEHERTGLLVENNAEAIASGMRRLMNDRQFAGELGRAGRRRVEQQFSIEKMVRETIAVYEQVTG